MVTMNLPYVCVISIQFFITGSLGQREPSIIEGTSSAASNPYQYTNFAYYSPRVSPYQNAYSSGAYTYPQPSASYAPYVRPSQSLAQSNQCSNFTAQQYYLGPMNAAQAQYLTAHIQYLINYGRNSPPTLQVQIPSTPTVNGSLAQATPPTIAVSAPAINESSAQATPPKTESPIETVNISSINSTDGVTNCSTVVSNTTTTQTFNTSDLVLKPANSLATNTNSYDPIVGAAQFQPNPFLTNTPYTVGNLFYNPVAPMYANLRQPFYPPGYGPWNPFVWSQAGLPTSPSNVAQEATPSNTNNATTKSAQESDSVVSPTIVSSNGEGGTSDIENLPPQVREFIEMIPDILAMPETSQLHPPANNAIIHKIGGESNVDGSETSTPAPRYRKPKISTRFRNTRNLFKSLRRRRHAGGK